MLEFAKAVSESVAFGANLLTLILAAIALWNLWFRRAKIALLLKVFLSSVTSERVKRIKETLGKLESLSYEEKGDRPEIVALLGQVSGQISNLVTGKNGLKPIHDEISEILAETKPLSEPTKRRIMYALHGTLDNISVLETEEILKEN